MDQISRVIGALEAGQDAQEERHRELAERVESMDGKLDLLLENQAAERAKRRVWATVRTAAASGVGGLIALGVQYLSSKGPP